MAAVVSVVGSSGAGKTSLIERILPILRDRGLAVGTVKHDVHGFAIDRPSSDTARHAEAGASPVLIAGPGRFALQWSGEEASLAALVARHFGGSDVVVAEGFSKEPGPKVLVHRSGIEPKALRDPDEVIVAVTDEPLGYARECTPEEPEIVAEEIVKQAEERPDLDVSLVVDGVDVPLQDFVARFLAGGVLGMIGTLKGIEEPEEVILQIARKR